MGKNFKLKIFQNSLSSENHYALVKNLSTSDKPIYVRMHKLDVAKDIFEEKNIFGHDGLMGSQVPIGVGSCYVSNKPTIIFVGDSAAEEDYVLSSIGWASTKNIPVLFVIEDNNLSILTEKKVRRSWDMHNVAKGFGGGADFVMLGGMLSGHDESEMKVIEKERRKICRILLACLQAQPWINTQVALPIIVRVREKQFMFLIAVQLKIRCRMFWAGCAQHALMLGPSV